MTDAELDRRLAKRRLTRQLRSSLSQTDHERSRALALRTARLLMEQGA